MTTNANKPSDRQDNFDAKHVVRELDGLQPNARAHFLELFPQIKAAKERGLPTRQIPATLASHGLKLSATAFDKFYEDASRKLANEELHKFLEKSRASVKKRRATTRQ